MRNPGRGSNAVALQNGHYIGFSVLGAMSQFVTVLVTPTDDGNEKWASVSSQQAGLQPWQSLCSDKWDLQRCLPLYCWRGANLTSISNRWMTLQLPLHAKWIPGSRYNTSNHTAVDNAITARGYSWDRGRINSRPPLQRRWPLRLV